MRKTAALFLVNALLIAASFTAGAQQRNAQAPPGGAMDLSGKWLFRIDSLDQGVDQHWYNQELPDQVTLPGSMTTNGKGNDITVNTPWTGGIVDSTWFHDPAYSQYRVPGHVKVPFWLQPDKYYKGVAWYQKTVDIPAAWKGQHQELFLERCHWETRVWVDDAYAGMQNSLGTAHRYDLSAMLTPGRHRITVRVDNRVKDINVGENSHSITDHTQGNWNGMAGRLQLRHTAPVYISDVQLYPDVKAQTVTALITAENSSGSAVTANITLQAHMPGATALRPLTVQQPLEKQTVIKAVYPMGNDAALWDEFNPNVYTMDVQLSADRKVMDEHKVLFGMRTFASNGTQFTINDRPVFLRGTLECAAFPKTGYPPTDTASWMRIMRICRSYGLNHLRFHSWCPPEAAFEAADRLGFYLHIECSSWANQGATIGDGKPLDAFIYDESNRIVKAYGNHPSFCMLLYGNEPAGKGHVKYLTEFVEYWKKKDPRRLYSTGAGWPIVSQSDFNSTPAPRIQQWGEGLKSIINSQPPRTDYDWLSIIKKWQHPTVSHEIGQWCVYPDFNEIKQYDGILKAKNFEIFRDQLEKNGLGKLAGDFLYASGKLQVLCYKADIEAGMRTGYAGYQLLDLHDFPGQGTALVGILDPFWNSKPYCTPAAFHRFSSSTVPLALIPKFTWKNTETFNAAVQVSHFGKDKQQQAPLRWRITGKDKRVLASGTLQADLDFRTDNPAGNISFDLSRIKSPEKLNLEITVGKLGVNDWDFWIYPDKVNTTVPANVVVTETLTQDIRQQLQNGASVLLLLNGKIKAGKGKEIKTGMSSVFWNTEWTSGQGPHTLGILCEPSSPLFNSFPTEYHSNWQWWDLLHTAQAMDLHGFPAALTPAVQLIDTWFDARKLALLFEARVGKGKIMVSSMDLTHNLEQRLGARQLYSSLLAYMGRKDFQPAVAVDIKDIQALYE